MAAIVSSDRSMLKRVAVVILALATSALLGAAIAVVAVGPRAWLGDSSGRTFYTATNDDYGLRGESCGSADRGVGTVIAPLLIDCLSRAFLNGESRFLFVRERTFEGDPIVVVYQVVGLSTLEVLHDSRDDRYGQPVLTKQRCRSVVFDPAGPLQVQPGDCDERVVLDQVNRP